MNTQSDDLSFEEDLTDKSELSENDDLSEVEQFDPDEFQDDEEAELEEGTDDEADETEADNEAEGQEAEDQPEAAALPDDTVVTMPDGSSLSLKELKDSPMLKADHTRKTQELSNQKATVTATAERLTRMTEGLVDYLSKMMPEEPTLALNATDPVLYAQQKNNYDASMAQLQQLIEASNGPKDVVKEMSAAERHAAAVEGNARLIEMFPEAANGESRTKFFEGVAQSASKLGFSQQELSSVTDPRVFALAHWAQKGMAAEQATAKAKQKVAKAPPTAPKKPSTRDGNVSAKRAEARKRLATDDSIENAVALMSIE